ncbi:acyltransferase [Steroidobacter agaridevorans]|uniref:[acyl-carrier-protein] S-malonyltransferase n=1 Tax=Steroidobacter agaridevorans TaxID=2695856 RepID=A0A829YJ96_9GAMM|nr:ACP S-malonyltransferase [Steroidobacter agaridevorans]GFE82923.1 acyltransferase [Steroidobacter agaridevorans]
MKVFMFPGQGSQARGMGGALFDEFEALTAKADSILGYSIKELCLEDPRNQLGQTQFTQPALFVVNALSYLKKVTEQGKPDFVAGHSLGEFNALLAAECFDFETGLRLVRRRGELMSRVSNGGMAAILNASKEEIETLLKRNGLRNIDLANYNTPSQIVISGQLDEITQAQSLFQVGTMLYYPLVTSGAFHSRFMRNAMEEFGTYLRTFKFSAPKIPVLANVTARPYEQGKIVDGLSSQIASTVRWCESIQYLMALAEHRGEAAVFEEVGYGDVLTRIFQTIKRQTPESALEPYRAELRRAGSSPRPAAQLARVPTDPSGKVVAWNTKYPVGTRVRSTLMDDQPLETRTPALVLFGHRAAVYMKGYNGYFDLDEVVPLKAC